MRRFSAILAVLALALVLTACGKDDDRNNGGSPSRPDTNQSQNAPQDNGSGGSWQNGTDTPTQPGAGENRQNGEDTLPGTQTEGRMGRRALRRGADSTATFRQMLENGYVHDCDGFLNDGENTSWKRHIRRDGAQGDSFSLRPLAFSKKKDMI